MASLRWDRLLEGAEAEEVYPLVHRNLNRLNFLGVPADVHATLDAWHKANVMRNAVLGRELARVLTLLADEGVPAAPLKGLGLAESLYGDPDLRTCADLDILVSRSDVGRAVELLRERAGYLLEFTDRFFESVLFCRDIEYGLVRIEYTFRHLLELHWDLWGPGWDDAAVEDLWATAKPRVVLRH